MRKGSESKNAGWGILLLFGMAGLVGGLCELGIRIFGGAA